MEENETHELKNSKRKAATTASINLSEDRHNSSTRKVSSLLRKRKKQILSEEDIKFLDDNQEHVKQFYKGQEKRAVLRIRQSENEDSDDILEGKCLELAQAIHDAEFLVVYTGAGISTSASIPDYRGPNGIWTKLQKGEDIGRHDLSAAIPTPTHMALSQLFDLGMVKHIVSQNCDGLHLRSGLPKTAMSEVHGNMYIEVCRKCSPAREYVRTFDVTEKTSTFQHATGRRCYKCGEPLIDSIVHFGERGRLRWPLNWQGACQAANACDTILCLGSSLKVLRKYPWLWQLNRSSKKRPRLYIVNLQWTPKDKDATLKINGKCDIILNKVMKYLGLEIEEYSKDNDPLFNIATSLNPQETNTTTQPILSPDEEPKNESPSNETGHIQYRMPLVVKKEEPSDEVKIKMENKPEIKLEDIENLQLKDDRTCSPPPSSNDFNGFENCNAWNNLVKVEPQLPTHNNTSDMSLSDNNGESYRNKFYGTGLCIRSEATYDDNYSSSEESNNDEPDSEESNTPELDSVDDRSNANSESDFFVKCEPDSSECEDRTRDAVNYSPKEISLPVCSPLELIFSTDRTQSCVESDKENEPLILEDLPKVDGDPRRDNYIKLYNDLVQDKNGISYRIETSHQNGVDSISDKDSPESLEDSENSENLKAIWVNSFSAPDSVNESSNNEDIKNIWFWGFDTQLEENRESVAKLRTLEMAMERRESPTERRITRSRSSKTSATAVGALPKCRCAAENSNLCTKKVPLSSDQLPDYSVTKSRDSFLRKRTLNYRRFSPTFDLSLPCVTYERKKRARKQYLVHKDEDDSNDGEVIKPKDNTNPGWYGKGYRRSIKKRKSQT